MAVLFKGIEYSGSLSPYFLAFFAIRRVIIAIRPPDTIPPTLSIFVKEKKSPATVLIKMKINIGTHAEKNHDLLLLILSSILKFSSIAFPKAR